MHILANDKRIALRKKIGERAPFVGLVVLVASTVILFAKPDWLALSMAIVWIGLLISLTGAYLGDRYVGPYAHHRKVPEALKGMPDDYTLFIYECSTPFVLLEQGGVTVLTVKNQTGLVSYNEKGWRHQQKFGFVRRFAGQEAVGRPDIVSNAEVESFQALLDKHMPTGVQVPVRGVILFTHPDVRIEAKNPPVPTLRASELKRWLRRNPILPKLSPAGRSAVFAACGVAEDDVESKE
jgi:hypothetical protein